VQQWALRAALALAVVGLVVLIRGWLPPLGSASPTPMPGVRHASPSAIPFGSGWTRAGPTYAQGITFAPSAPETAYTCGILSPTGQDGRGQVALGVSLDGGASWLTLPTPATKQQTCQLTVNPLDARDVVLATNLYSSSDPAPPAGYYRSFDGGQTWRDFPLPPSGAGAPGASYVQWAWVNSSLYVTPYYSDDDAYRRLAVSRGGGAFRWLDTRPLFGGLPAGARINTLISAAQALYVQVDYSATDCSNSPDCYIFRRTSDGGATWRNYAPTLAGKPLYLLDDFGLQNGNRVIFAGYDLSSDGRIQRYVRSTDGGETWASLPPLPDAELGAIDLVQTPSGYIYANVWSSAKSQSAQLGVYALAPGGRSWRFVAPYSVENDITVVVARDARGQPLALWGPATQPNRLGVSLGLMRHAP
jgi:hypothetical protein